MHDIRLLLDNIRSVHNVGSIFRTAEGIGVSHIYCIGTTPVPIDRFGRTRTDLAKVALGAEEMVPWEHAATASRIISKLKKEGFQVIALEQSPHSRKYSGIKPKKKCLIIVGNEVGGVSPSLLTKADVIAEIPMRGKKESLNVAVATGIALYRLFE